MKWTRWYMSYMLWYCDECVIDSLAWYMYNAPSSSSISICTSRSGVQSSPSHQCTLQPGFRDDKWQPAVVRTGTGTILQYNRVALLPCNVGRHNINMCCAFPCVVSYVMFVFCATTSHPPFRYRFDERGNPSMYSTGSEGFWASPCGTWGDGRVRLRA